jgi:uncharacterized integral membrane protein
MLNQNHPKIEVDRIEIAETKVVVYQSSNTAYMLLVSCFVCVVAVIALTMIETTSVQFTLAMQSVND